MNKIDDWTVKRAIISSNIKNRKLVNGMVHVCGARGVLSTAHWG